MNYLTLTYEDFSAFSLDVKLLFLVNILFLAPPPPLPLPVNEDDVTATTINIFLTPSSDSNGKVV